MDVIVILLFIVAAVIAFRILGWFSGWLIILSPAIVGYFIASSLWDRGYDNWGVIIGLTVFFCWVFYYG